VTNVADSGAGSLRQAILNANAHAAADRITFNIAGAGLHSIHLLSALPNITLPVVIDGYTQPGSAPNTLDCDNNAVLNIELEGSAAGFNTNGLTIVAANSIVRGLIINRFGASGINLSGGGAAWNYIEGDFIGTNAAGTAGQGNRDGVLLNAGAHDNVIGGFTNGTRNVISGNVLGGVVLFDPGTNNNEVVGNFAGTNKQGTASVPNGRDGVVIFNSSQNNHIGGAAPGAGNLLSGNNRDGVRIDNPGTTGNVVQGNSIGTACGGAAALGNAVYGVSLTAPRNTIGGLFGEGNLISGNANYGVYLYTPSANNDRVAGNQIGTNAAGTGALPNPQGVVIDAGAHDNRIGSVLPGATNLISGNNGPGVHITGSGTTGNVVRGNFIGTDVTGTTARPNQGDGVLIDGGAQNNTVGGVNPAARNLISGNNGEGIKIFKTDVGGLKDTRNNTVQGNYIGTDVTGTVSVSNQNSGIFVPFSENNNISGNLVSGNAGFAGIAVCAQSPCGGLISGVGNASGNVLQGNLVGTDATGTTPLGNANFGISLDGIRGTGSLVGGPTASAKNVIAFNGSIGVIFFNNAMSTTVQGNQITSNVGAGVLVAGSNNVVRDNTIASNGDDGIRVDTGIHNLLRSNAISSHSAGLGIRLVNGGNNSQAFPVLTSAATDGTTLTVTGQLNSLPSTLFALEFFSNSVCNPSGFGEGEQPLQPLQAVITDGSGFVSFSFPFAAVPVGYFITATATDPVNNTSAFSACVAVAAGEGGGGDGAAVPEEQPLLEKATLTEAWWPEVDPHPRTPVGSWPPLTAAPGADDSRLTSPFVASPPSVPALDLFFAKHEEPAAGIWPELEICPDLLPSA
jgi:titin